MEPKKWLQSEIYQLMAEEMRAYKHDCLVRRRSLSYDEMAENVFMALDSRGLIKYTP